MDAITSVPAPVNEPVQTYAPGSPERTSIEGRLAEMAAAEPVELTAVIDGEHRHAGGDAFDVTMPSDHAHVLGRAHHSTAADAEAAIAAATAGGSRLGGHGLRRPGGDLPAGGRPAGRSVARHAQRRDHARPGQDGAAGRDRRRLRADRLPALQRRLRPADPGRSADLLTGGLEPDRLPAAGRFRLRDHAVQLHRDRRQPGHGARADGQHGDLEAEPDPAAGGALHVRDPGGGRTAAGGDQPAAR